MNFDNLIKARKILGPLWQEACLKGRCWGPKRPRNPYSASNITLAVKDELVSISQQPDGSLLVNEFIKTSGTKLGTRIKKLFKKERLNISN